MKVFCGEPSSHKMCEHYHSCSCSLPAYPERNRDCVPILELHIPVCIQYHPHSRSLAAEPERNRDCVPILDLHVPLCCQNCERKLRKKLEELDGVQRVISDQVQQEVTIIGFVDADRVLEKVRHVKDSKHFQEKTDIKRRYCSGSSSDGRQCPWCNDHQRGEDRTVPDQGDGSMRSTSSGGDFVLLSPLDRNYESEVSFRNGLVTTNPSYMKHVKSQYH